MRKRIFARDKIPYASVNERLATLISCEESRDFFSHLGICGKIISTPSHSADSIFLMLDEGDCLAGDLEPPEYLKVYAENAPLKKGLGTHPGLFSQTGVLRP